MNAPFKNLIAGEWTGSQNASRNINPSNTNDVVAGSRPVAVLLDVTPCFVGDCLRGVGQQIRPYLSELAGMAFDEGEILVISCHGDAVEFVGEEADGVVEILVKIDVGHRIAVRARIGT